MQLAPKLMRFMPIPDFQTVMRPVLAAVADGAPLALSALRERIIDEFQLSEEERHERLPSGRQTVINYLVGWARTQPITSSRHKIRC